MEEIKGAKERIERTERTERTLKELQEEKAGLEKSIKQLINNFNEKYNVQIESIDFNYMNLFSKMEISNFTLKVLI
jgi:phage host-nuclease inhibitor protein Gam